MKTNLILGLTAFSLLAMAADGDGLHGSAASLSRPASAVEASRPDGFLRRWLLLEPIPIPIRSNAQLTDSFVQATLKKDYFPGQFTIVPKDGDKVPVAGADLAWHAVQSSAYNVNLYHFARGKGKQPLNAVYWAVTIVHCPRELRDVRLAAGSNSASIWWVNGQEVVDLYGDRHLLADDGVSKRLTLNKGPNIVRGAIVNGPGLSDMCARFLDRDDKPLTACSTGVGAPAK